MHNYDGSLRIDMGPLVPVPGSLERIRVGGRNGLLCRMNSMDFGRVSVRCADEVAMLDIMDAFDGETAIHRLAVPLVSRGDDGRGRLVFEMRDESPRFGLLGHPLRSFEVDGTLRKAVAMHGRVENCGRRDGSFLIRAKSARMDVFLVVRGRPAEILSKTGIPDGWLLCAGYGGILKPDGGVREPSVYMDDVRFLSPAASDVPVFGRAGTMPGSGFGESFSGRTDFSSAEA